MNPQFNRRQFARCVMFGGLIGLSGCADLALHSSHSPAPDAAKAAAKKPRLIGDLAVPFGLTPVRVESIALVGGLAATGSDPAPSAEREILLSEMRERGVEKPNTLLASRNGSLVLIRAYLPAGVQKGERVDVEVRIPSHSETTSLAGGYLLEARLKEMGLFGSQVRNGFPLAIAEGPVLVDPSAKGGEDHVSSTRGKVLGGAVVLKSRPLGLVLKHDHEGVRNAALIASAINRRFYSIENGLQKGMADAKTKQYVRLELHPKYKDNIDRYVNVVRAVCLRESQQQLLDRINRLKEELIKPQTAAGAALQLEAIGREGIEALRDGMQSRDMEVRFYAAESLAYLDQSEAAEPLARIAREAPAFRVFALTALSTLDDRTTADQLVALFGAASAETRYGAFRALKVGNPSHPMVVADPSVKGFSYHVLETDGPQMVHVTHSRFAEIVLFGRDQRFHTPLSVSAGNQIQVTASAGSNEVAVSKYAVHEPDQKRIVSTRVDDVIRAIVEIGGTYPDVVRALQEAKASDALPSRFEVDAVPQAGIAYDRGGIPSTDKPDAEDKDPKPPARSPGLFSKSDGNQSVESGGPAKNSDEKSSDSGESAGKPAAEQGFFGRMFGWDSEPASAEK